MNIKNMENYKVAILVVCFVVLALLLYYFFQTNNIYSSVTSAVNMQIIPYGTLPTNNNTSNFAYSIWFYINDWSYQLGSYKMVLGRNGGISTDSSACVSNPNQYSSGYKPCPVIYLDDYDNNLGVSLTVQDGSLNVVNTFTVSNVPLQKWVNLVASVYGRTLDIYIDGKLVSTNVLDGVCVISANADLYITPCGGFNGWTSKLQYYTTPLNPQQVWNIYKQGYGAGYFSNLFNQNQLTVTINKNGVPTSSFTI
jgi:Concanavalin A-like lectin/glucanases superfamily